MECLNKVTVKYIGQVTGIEECYLVEDCPSVLLGDGR